MAGLNGLDAAARIVKEYPDVRVLMLSAHANEEYVRQALCVGAAGYLLKDGGLAELELAVRAVARGETYLSPAISKQVIANYIRHADAEISPRELLTPRQREILQLIELVPGVDHTITLSLTADTGSPQCGDIPLCPTALVRSGPHQIEVL